MSGEMLANYFIVPINAKYNQTKKIMRLPEVNKLQIIIPYRQTSSINVHVCCQLFTSYRSKLHLCCLRLSSKWLPVL